MIDWSSITIISPPILRNISTVALISIVRDKKNPEWDFVHFPCHTQAVERCVKLGTEASIRSMAFKIETGSLDPHSFPMPEFDNKADFKPLPAD
ncbi:hypothetical protein AVEN_180856-1 [Araneus ventricosus]|uniref:Uncharacterized protein n=1 Tax=Araneus ventricosus TaxID=182803 RepID=A0A4Y2H9S3_ARAVE|nr:hypothetical protein AVEN_180856-1 [Araneus ventricosus]